ncbi:Polysaccharide deacetylase [Sporobacter termitidis DSM 10068]|uniref:Polysaccharide deacetylase n=1 Tax=Sporobacter termitidis DSM 10068 TaxID=1123282 RepID=A0A1M5YIE9_9FIRM|nr:polysaccharide deacetylase family protein [Sporobacter termitidis]SHI11313.1 Polysaccharide deacetylase [Sporobacter termitidis DSM 10068]
MIRKSVIILLIFSLLFPCLPRRAGALDASQGEGISLPIIMYHEIKHSKLGKDVVSPWEFESDLKYLKRKDYNTVTMHDLTDWFYNRAPLPPNPIMLTFDDGYLSTYKYALPLLKKYDMKIVLSLIVKNTDDFTRNPDTNIDYSHVTWAQLNEMLDSGLVEVQNHSYNLHVVKNGRYGCVRKKSESLAVYEQILKTDLTKAQSEIFQQTGVLPTTFAYPYGRYSEDTDTILRALGFQATLSCRYGINVLSHEKTPDLYRLKRLCRAHGNGIGALLDEAYKTIKKKPPAEPQVLK